MDEKYVLQLMERFKLSKKDAQALYDRMMLSGNWDQVARKYPGVREEPAMVPAPPREAVDDPSAWSAAPRWGANDLPEMMPDPWAAERPVRPTGNLVGNPAAALIAYARSHMMKQRTK